MCSNKDQVKPKINNTTKIKFKNPKLKKKKKIPGGRLVLEVGKYQGNLGEVTRYMSNNLKKLVCI